MAAMGEIQRNSLTQRDKCEPPRVVGRLARNLLNAIQAGMGQAERSVVIYLDDYRKAQAADNSERYADEILRVNWNPALVALAASSCPASREPAPALPDDLSQLDVEAFLDRVYALATHV